MEWSGVGPQETIAERLLPAVRQVMQVLEVTSGGARREYAARFRGRLMIDSQEAYQRLEPLFAREGTTLLFRREGREHTVLAVSGRIQVRPSKPWVNLILFAGTLLSVIFAGMLYGYTGPTYADQGRQLAALLSQWQRGIPFAASLLGILLAHEFGHYLAARFHRTAVTLPYFIPFPGSTFGTMGAFIQLKSPPRNRRVLLDIGLAGPLAGLVVAIPVLLFGLSLSEVGRLPASPAAALGQGIEGNSILYLAAKFVVTGQLLPAPAGYGGMSPLLYWLRYFFLGHPLPFGGTDVFLHPVAWAGWAGLLVTSLNLIPAGQLDGGHVLFVLFGRRAVRLMPFIVVALAALGIVWPGWWLWAALIFVLGRAHAQPLDDITPLDGKRKGLAYLGLILFFLLFTPVPLQALG
ncbi:MAG: site-2 protease family protein [Chloroflexota bacterium]